MAVFPPDDSINRIVSAFGLENVRSLTISVAVNSAVAVVTEQYVTGNQMENLATALETKEWMLVPKDAGRWIPVTERLPEDRVSVLTSGEDPVDGGFMLIGYREPESRFGPAHWHLPCFAEFGPVTHWMPLPEPPEET